MTANGRRALFHIYQTSDKSGGKVRCSIHSARIKWMLEELSPEKRLEAYFDMKEFLALCEQELDRMRWTIK